MVPADGWFFIDGKAATRTKHRILLSPVSSVCKTLVATFAAGPMTGEATYAAGLVLYGSVCLENIRPGGFQCDIGIVHGRGDTECR